MFSQCSARVFHRCCSWWKCIQTTFICFYCMKGPIGLYRDVWIAAIASSTTSLATRTAAICVRFQGRRVRRVYVTMQITFLTRKSTLIYRRGLRQRVASLTLNCNGDFAIRAYSGSVHVAGLARFQYDICNSTTTFT